MTKRVLLALSSFRHNEQQIQYALDLCRQEGAELLTLFVVDVNLARYFAGTGVMAGTSLREQMEQGLMDDQVRQAQDVIDRVRQLAAEQEVSCRSVLKVGRFAVEARALVAAEGPQVMVVTRARRPEWLRKLFGSPVDSLRKDAGGSCEVRIVDRKEDRG